MKYFSMFSGIGGFEKAIQNVLPDAKCVGFSEIDKFAKSIYLNHYPEHKDYGDATGVISESIADFDLLVGGFPCQAFSIAGQRKGFNDVRGTLFFEIARILRDKRPRYFLLENVKGLLSHEQGETFKTILEVLSGLGYRVEWQILNSKHFGVPQNRERVFFVGCLGEECCGEILPIRQGRELFSTTHGGKQKEQQRICSTIDSRYGSLRNSGETYVGVMRNRKDGKGFRRMESNVAPTLNARARQDGDMQPVVVEPRAVLTPDRAEKRQNGRRFKEAGEPAFTLTAQDKHGVMIGSRIRRLTPIECERLQGFPDDWTKYGAGGKPISDTQRYKCCGNAVTVNVIEAVFRAINKFRKERKRNERE